MQPIGLIAAMTQESDALLRCITGWKHEPLGSYKGSRFQWAGRECILVTSGMGVRRARDAARCLLDASAPRWLVSFGIAGAVEADLEIGDVVMAEAVCRLDGGAPGPCLPLNPWPEAAREAAAQALARCGRSLFRGTAITTAGSQVTKDQLMGLVHPVLEMETAGIAQAAQERGASLLAIRAISDGPRAPIPFDLGEMMDEDANLRTSRLLMAIIRRPAVLLQSRRMMRNSNIAAENAATALLAALEKLAW